MASAVVASVIRSGTIPMRLRTGSRETGLPRQTSRECSFIEVRGMFDKGLCNDQETRTRPNPDDFFAVVGSGGKLSVDLLQSRHSYDAAPCCKRSECGVELLSNAQL